jgi:hypothetical protein
VAFGNLNLGNVAEALRLTGADPSWLEEREREEQLAAMQRRPDVPPATNQALETLGSSYRVPEPREPQPNPYEEPRVPSVSATPFNPNAPTRQLRGEQVAMQNEALELKGRHGDIANKSDGQIAAEGFDQQAAAAREMEDSRRAGLSQVRERVDTNRTQQQDFEAQALEHYNQITALAGQQPDASRGKALQVVAAVLSMTPRGAQVGKGLNMLGNMMASDVQRWGQQMEAQRVAQTAALGMAAHEQADSEHELQMEKQLVDLGYGVYGAALERVKAETSSQEAVSVATELQNGLRQNYVAHQLDLNARTAAAGARRQQGRADERLETMDLDLLAQEIAAGNVGERGQAIYAKRVKRSQDLREGEGKIAKLQREGEGGTGEEVLPGYVSTVALGPSDKTTIRANAMAVNDIISDIGKLRAIRARNDDGGTWNADDRTQAEGIMGRMSTKLSQMNGAGAPSEGERELFAKSLVDPTGFYARKHPIKLYGRMAVDFRSSFNSKLKAIGIVPAGARSGGGGLGFEQDPDKRLGQVTRGSSGGW